MRLTLVTAPTQEPASLEDALTFLRVDNADEAPLVEALLAAGREIIEKYTSRALLTQTLKATVDAFPTGRTIELPRVPLASVTSIKYWPASGGAQTTWDSSNYTVITATNQIVILDGTDWPDTAVRPDAVEITYGAGATAPGAVPAPLRHAVLLMCSHLYENRATVANAAMFDVPMSLKHILEAYKTEGWCA